MFTNSVVVFVGATPSGRRLLDYLFNSKLCPFGYPLSISWMTSWLSPKGDVLSSLLVDLTVGYDSVIVLIQKFWLWQNWTLTVTSTCGWKNQQLIHSMENILFFQITVYKLTCSCGASYIGQTQRNLINRIEEHRTSHSSAVCRHLQANPDHRVDFHNPEIIGSDNNGRRLQILESLLIQEHRPELNANIPSMPLYIFNL